MFRPVLSMAAMEVSFILQAAESDALIQGLTYASMESFDL
jgi:hypothetical protein